MITYIIIQEQRKKSEFMKFKRVFLMILDSLGVGEAKDASNYDDNGCNHF